MVWYMNSFFSEGVAKFQNRIWPLSPIVRHGYLPHSPKIHSLYLAKAATTQVQGTIEYPTRLFSNIYHIVDYHTI